MQTSTNLMVFPPAAQNGAPAQSGLPFPIISSEYLADAALHYRISQIHNYTHPATLSLALHHDSSNGHYALRIHALASFVRFPFPLPQPTFSRRFLRSQIAALATIEQHHTSITVQGMGLVAAVLESVVLETWFGAFGEYQVWANGEVDFWVLNARLGQLNPSTGAVGFAHVFEDSVRRMESRGGLLSIPVEADFAGAGLLQQQQQQQVHVAVGGTGTLAGPSQRDVVASTQQPQQQREEERCVAVAGPSQQGPAATPPSQGRSEAQPAAAPRSEEVVVDQGGFDDDPLGEDDDLFGEEQPPAAPPAPRLALPPRPAIALPHSAPSLALPQTRPADSAAPSPRPAKRPSLSPAPPQPRSPVAPSPLRNPVVYGATAYTAIIIPEDDDEAAPPRKRSKPMTSERMREKYGLQPAAPPRQVWSDVPVARRAPVEDEREVAARTPKGKTGTTNPSTAQEKKKKKKKKAAWTKKSAAAAATSFSSPLASSKPPACSPFEKEYPSPASDSSPHSPRPEMVPLSVIDEDVDWEKAAEDLDPQGGLLVLVDEEEAMRERAKVEEDEEFERQLREALGEEKEE